MFTAFPALLCVERLAQCCLQGNETEIPLPLLEGLLFSANSEDVHVGKVTLEQALQDRESAR